MKERVKFIYEPTQVNDLSVATVRELNAELLYQKYQQSTNKVSIIFQQSTNNLQTKYQ
jgi:hypothetical protein